MNGFPTTQRKYRVDAPQRRARRPRGAAARAWRRLAFEAVESRLMLSGTEVDTSLFNLDSLAADFAIISPVDVGHFSGTSASPEVVTSDDPRLLDVWHLINTSVFDASEGFDVGVNWPSSTSVLDASPYTINFDTSAETNAVDQVPGTAYAGLVGGVGDSFVGSPDVGQLPFHPEVAGDVLVIAPSTAGSGPQNGTFLADSTLSDMIAAASRESDLANIGGPSQPAAAGRAPNEPIVGIVFDSEAAPSTAAPATAPPVDRLADVYEAAESALMQWVVPSQSESDEFVLFDRVAVGGGIPMDGDTDAIDAAVAETEPETALIVERRESDSVGVDGAIEGTTDAADVEERARTEGGMISIESLIAALEAAPFDSGTEESALAAGSEQRVGESESHEETLAAVSIQGEMARAVAFELIEARPAPLARAAGADREHIAAAQEAAQWPLLVDRGEALRSIQPALFAESMGERSGARLAAIGLPADGRDSLAGELNDADRGAIFANWLEPVAEQASSFGISPLLVMVALERIASNRRRRDVESAGPPKPQARNRVRNL